MKTPDRRAIADRALSQIDKLELEIRAQMLQHNIDEFDADYANFKAYATLRDLHTQYQGWKDEYRQHADNEELVQLVGQSEHDILREHYDKVSSATQIITIQTTDDSYFYERDTGMETDEKVHYSLAFDRVKPLSFGSCHVEALDSLFIRVNLAGIAT